MKTNNPTFTSDTATMSFHVRQSAEDLLLIMVKWYLEGKHYEKR